MKAVVFETFGGGMDVRSVPDPAPEPDGVVVRVRATGICRSDWHAWQGHDPDVRLPHVPGHELAGEIEAVGREVRGFQVGDRVTVPFVSGCGRCAPCREGQPQVCLHQYQPGFTGWGSFAELVALRHADLNLVRLPESLGFVEAASLGCRFVTAFRAVVQLARLQPGEWLAVHGCGGVGLSVVMIASGLGAQVIALDVRDEPLALAREFGARHTLRVGDAAETLAQVREWSGGGTHVGVDALGHPASCRLSILGLRPRGRHVQVGLLLGEHQEPPVPMATVIARELQLFGSHGMAASGYPPLLAWMASGRLTPARLVRRTIALEDAPEALAGMTHFRDAGMTVVDRFAK